MFKPIVIAALCLLPLCAAAFQEPNMEGVWAGRDADGAVLSLHFVGSTVVISDAKLVLIGSWKSSKASLVIEVEQAVNRTGGILALGRTANRTFVLRRAPKGQFCLLSTGIGARLTGSTKAERCWSLKNVTSGFDRCVSKCVQQNQMRAVGPDVIENDCRAQCRGE